jgi:transposase
MNYVGIDHHRQYSHITWLDEKGEVVKSGRVANLRRELEEFLQGVRDVKAVIETGRSSYTMVDVLADLGIETTVAHPKDVKAIAKAKVKTDERDSYKLAHLLRTGYIPEVHKRSRENRSSQRVLRQRAFYVGKQTAVKNRLRALLVQQGEEIRTEVSRVENLFILKKMGSEPQKGAAMFRNRITTLQHSELWRDALTRFMAERRTPVPAGLTRMIKEWFTRTVPSSSA